MQADNFLTAVIVKVHFDNILKPAAVGVEAVVDEASQKASS